VARRSADGMMARMPELSRRAILRLGVGAAAGPQRLHVGHSAARTERIGCWTAGCDDKCGARWRHPTAGAPATAAPTYVNGSFVSAAAATCQRIGRSPPAGPDGCAHPVIALHGKGRTAG